MNLASLKTVATQTVGRGLLYARKFSPEALTVIGIAGVVTSTVIIAKQTLKLEETIDKSNERIEFVKERQESEGDLHNPKEFKKDLAKAKGQAVVDVVKLYGPGITLGVAGIVCIVSAQGIMRKRNLALVAAYKSVEEAFTEYKKRVVAEIGEDKERDIRFGLTDEQITADDGTTKVVTHIDPNRHSQYAAFFDELNPNFQRQPEYNLMFLRAQQSYFNDKLAARGHVFLNEVYDALGIARTSAGNVVGWVVSKDGDNFIDFNIYDFTNDRKRLFVNGEENAILLDFNVDGVILDKI